MNKTRSLSVAGCLTAVAILLQIGPAILSEALAAVTTLSALPIYVIARASPRTGVLAVFTTAIIVSMISPHEGLFFLGANGPVGLSLGVCHHFGKSRTATTVIAGLSLACTLSALSLVGGVPILWTHLSGPAATQLALMLLYSTGYAALYERFAASVFSMFANIASVKDERAGRVRGSNEAAGPS